MITETQAQEHLDAWLTADLALTKQQSYQMDGVTLTRADAAQVTEKIRFWQGELARIKSRSGGNRRVNYVV